METPPSVHKRLSVARDQPQDPTRFALVTTDGFPNIQFDQIDDDHPSRSKNVGMRGRVIVGVDYNPQTSNAQGRGHKSILLKPNRFGKTFTSADPACSTGRISIPPDCPKATP